MTPIPVSGPWITQKEVDYVTEAVKHGWYSKANVFNERFERAFAARVGVKYAISLPSCTSAIHLGLLSLGVGPDDEVIVPDATWIATSAPISYVGAKPVFADIDPDTWCISSDAFEQCLTQKTKALIAVDLYGGMPDWDRIRKLAERRRITVIEDAAEAIGSEYHGRMAGGLGHVGVFSFHGSKTLTTGEGGMLITDDQDVYRRALLLRDHGRDPGPRMFWNTEVAHKYKMSSLQAALGLAQLERLDELVARKRQIFSWYRNRLTHLYGVSLNQEPFDTKNSFWMVTAVVDPGYGIEKETLIQSMKDRGIACRPFFYPLSALPAYAGADEARRAAARNRNAYRISPYGINLPSGLNLTEEQVSYVCQALAEILDASAKRTSEAPLSVSAR